MATETGHKDIIDEIQERIDILTKESKEVMREAGGNLGRALWKFPLSGFSLLVFINITQHISELSKQSDNTPWFWVGSAFVAGACVYSGSGEILLGIHHIRSHNSIMREISSHRAAISRRLENSLHN